MRIGLIKERDGWRSRASGSEARAYEPVARAYVPEGSMAPCTGERAPVPTGGVIRLFSERRREPLRACGRRVRIWGLSSGLSECPELAAGSMSASPSPFCARGACGSSDQARGRGITPGRTRDMDSGKDENCQKYGASLVQVECRVFTEQAQHFWMWFRAREGAMGGRQARGSVSVAIVSQALVCLCLVTPRPPWSGSLPGNHSRRL